MRYDGKHNPNYKGGPVDLVCSNCEKEFQKSRGAYNAFVKRNQGGRFYCCRKCADEGKKKFNVRTKDSRIEMICDHCKESFKQYKSQRRGEVVFCSPKCRKAYFIGDKCQNYIGPVEFECITCGKECSITRSETGGRIKERKFCSLKCRDEYMKGEHSPHWKGGIAPFSMVLRGIKEYQEWMQLVLLRDNYTCTECGSKENIQVHHKETWGKMIMELKIESVEQARITPELWNTDNGASLCIQCHAEKHPRYKKLMLQKIA
jgi:hypothetical protein